MEKDGFFPKIHPFPIRLEFKPEAEVDAAGGEVVGDGVLLAEDGFDPGLAGLIADIEEIEYLEAHPAIAGPAEDIIGFGGLP